MRLRAMSKKNKSIPVNVMADKFGAGIAIGRASIKDIRTFEEAKQTHRDDYHLFFLQEKGTTPIQIDFQEYRIEPSSVVYIYPGQVHRMVAFENITLSFLALSSENINPEYLKLLEDITPGKPLLLGKDIFSLIAETVLLCIKISERKNENLYRSLLRHSCNMVVALVASQYLNQIKQHTAPSRIELVAKSFKAALELNFVEEKRPASYAKTLNVSTGYLNECVKSSTGFSVTHHIQQRIILEAKRLLYHSDKSVKQIAAELGFDDYPYFSRLFAKVAGTTPMAFRNLYPE